MSALRVGDCVFYGTAGPAPWRVRHLDTLPGGKVNIVVSPAASVVRFDLEGIGVFNPTDTIRRAVIS